MVFEVNYKLFREGVRKVIQVSLSRGAPWYVYTIDWGGMVKKSECTVVIDEFRVKATSICREVEKAKSFTLTPVLIIRSSEDVLTVVTVD
jgi:hypothetical protein